MSEVFGRKKEFALLERQIHSELKGVKVTLISGPGGIGKTTLLNEFRVRTAQRFPKVRVVPLIDLADPHRRSIQAIMNEVSDALRRTANGHTFDPYVQDRENIELMELSNVGPEIISHSRLRLLDTFVLCYNRIAEHNPILLVLDSAEYVTTEDFWESLFDLVKKLDRTLLLVAGRPSGVENASHWAKTKLQRLRIPHIVLGPLNLKDSRELLQQLGGGVTASLARKIFQLTEGMPILLVLAGYRLHSGFDLGGLANQSYQQFKVLPGERIRERFRAALVDFLLEPKSDVEQLVLWMGHIDKGFDPEVIQYLTGYPEAKSKRLMNEIRRLKYAKPIGNRSILHEDVVSLVRANVWPLIDPFKKQRQELSQKVTSLLDKRISQLDEDQGFNRRQVNDAVKQRKQPTIALAHYRFSHELFKQYAYERMAYETDFDVNRAVEHFKEAFDNDPDLSYQGELLRLAEGFGDLPNAIHRFATSIRRARWCTNKGDFEGAQREFDKWAGINELPGPDKVDLLSAQANLHRRSGRLPDAIGTIDQAIELASTQAFNLVPQLTQTKGLFMRLMGRLDQAVKFYGQAIASMPVATDTEKLELAKVMNNLAFVLGVQGDWVTGLQWCEHAFKLRQELGGPSDVASSLVTRGSLFWAKGDYATARRQYDLVLELVELPRDTETQARAYYSYGIADWFARDFRAADAHFTRSIEIMREHNYAEQLPLAIHDLGHIEWELGQLELTERLFQEGYELSLKYGDHQALIDTLVGFAELYHEMGRTDEISRYVEELEKLENQGFRFPLFAGRMERIQGEIAFDRKDYEAAVTLFVKGIARIAEHGGYGKYSLREEFLRLGQRMDLLPLDTMLEWCTFIERNWPKQGHPEGRREMEAFVNARRAIAGKTQ